MSFVFTKNETLWQCLRQVKAHASPSEVLPRVIALLLGELMSFQNPKAQRTCLASVLLLGVWGPS